MTKEAADRVKRIREYLSKMTPGPWLVRPLQFDDWGTIRCAENAHIVALARNGGIDYDAVAHRTNKTDPFSDNAEGIAKLRTDAEWLLSQLSASEERVREQLAIIRDRAQGELEDAETLVQARSGLQAIASYVESLLPSPPKVEETK